MNNFKTHGRWSIEAIRQEAQTYQTTNSKIHFFHDVITFITKSNRRKNLSLNASIVIKKIERLIEDLYSIKPDLGEERRLDWTGDNDTLIYFFYKLKNNALGKENKPLLNASNRKIAKLIKQNFNIGLSEETIYDKLNPVRVDFESKEESPEWIMFSIGKIKKR